MTRPLVAVIDDDPIFVDLMRAFLESEGYLVVSCLQAADAVALVREHDPAVVILDLRLEAVDGGQRVLEALGVDRPPVIVCSADIFFMQQHAEWLNTHAEGTLAKPFDLDDLLELVQRTSGIQPLAS